MKFLLILFISINIAESYKILVPLPFTFRSISNLYVALGNRLAENGHSVTIMTPYGVTKTHPNVQIVVLPEEMQRYDKYNFFTIRETKEEPWGDPANFVNTTKLFLADTRVQELWTRRNEFDAIIIDCYLQEMAYHFLIGFEGALVEVISTGVDPECLGVLGNRMSPALVPSFILGSSFTHTSFWDRLKNFVIQHFAYEMMMGGALTQIQALQKEKYPGLNTYSYYKSQVDLTLMNMHFTGDYVVPLLPNQVQIGCLNCISQNNIPKDLLEFIEGSGDAGVIYFSLGSMVKPEHIPKDKLASLLEALGQLPQRVIMKLNWEKGLPPNVIARKWLPQQDILAHPKTRLFISHCGLQSVQETRYHGVPILAVPIIFDQPANAYAARDVGIAEVLEWEDITVAKALQTIKLLLNDDSYRRRAKTISRLMQDQMETPVQRANWWLEYIIRNHKTANVYYKGQELHVLHYRGKDLSMMQHLMVDVILFFVCICLTIVIITWCGIRRLFTKKQKPKNKKKTS